jgi:hypothetical protein
MYITGVMYMIYVYHGNGRLLMVVVFGLANAQIHAYAITDTAAKRREPRNRRTILGVYSTRN